MKPSATNFFAMIYLGSPWGILWGWLTLINIVTFFTYGVDKLFAKCKEKHPKVPRLPERNLLLLAVVGGGLGAWLGMLVFRHKTQHNAFRFTVPFMLVFWIVMVTGLYVYFNFIR